MRLRPIAKAALKTSHIVPFFSATLPAQTDKFNTSIPYGYVRYHT